MSKLKLTLLIAVLLTLVRVAIVYFEQISPGEAYFAACAAHPAPAYFDGPAGTALTVGQLELWSSFSGRAAAPVWALAATLACFYLVRRLNSESAGFWAAMALNALPIFNIYALRISPELPALTFVLLGAYAGWRAFDGEKRAPLWWTLAGLLIGVAANFVYEAVVLAPALVIFLWYSRKHRNAEGILSGVIVLAIPLLCLLPALMWNAEQNWIPLAGGTLQTAWQFDPGGAASALWRTIYLISPVVAIGLLLVWIICGRGAGVHLRARFIFIGALPGILLGIYQIYRGEDPLFFFLMATPFLLARSGELIALMPMGHLWARVAVLIAVVLTIPAAMKVYDEGREWPAAAAQMRKVFTQRLEEGQDNLFLIAQDAPMASVLAYYLRDDLIPPPGHPAVYVQASQDISNQYALWPSYDDFIATERPVDEFFTEQKGENPFMERDALYVTREPLDALPQAIQGAFEEVRLVDEIGGPDAERLYIYLCVNYQTLPL